MLCKGLNGSEVGEEHGVRTKDDKGERQNT